MADVNVFDVLVDSLREKQCTDSQILNEISKLFDAFGFYSSSGNNAKLDEKTKVMYILDEFGIPRQVLGYKYLLDSVLEYRKAPCMNMRKGIYSKISEKYGVSEDSVDRAIRSGIESACKKGRIGTMQKLFGSLISENLGKPTNSQAIPAIAEKVDYFDFSAMEEKNSFESFIQHYKAEGYSEHHIIIELGKVFKEYLTIKNMDVHHESETVKAEKMQVASILEGLGISSNITGFHYLMEAVILYRQNLNHNYKEIYSRIADKFNSTSLRVEDAIARALELATKKGRPSIMESVFGCMYRPDNNQAITMLAKAIG